MVVRAYGQPFFLPYTPLTTQIFRKPLKNFAIGSMKWVFIERKVNFI
jgi:hypothetical protein